MSSKKAKKRARETYLKRTYGITISQYNTLLKKQNNGCWICGKTPEEESRNLAVDHAHGESKWVPKNAIRGLLCSYCNRRIIGRHKDADLLLKASEYLRRHTGHIAPVKKRKRKRK